MYSAFRSLTHGFVEDALSTVGLRTPPSSNHAFQTITKIAFFCSNLEVPVDDRDCEEYS